MVCERPPQRDSQAEKYCCRTKDDQDNACPPAALAHGMSVWICGHAIGRGCCCEELDIYPHGHGDLVSGDMLTGICKQRGRLTEMRQFPWCRVALGRCARCMISLKRKITVSATFLDFYFQLPSYLLSIPVQLSLVLDTQTGRKSRRRSTLLSSFCDSLAHRIRYRSIVLAEAQLFEPSCVVYAILRRIMKFVLNSPRVPATTNLGYVKPPYRDLFAMRSDGKGQVDDIIFLEYRRRIL